MPERPAAGRLLDAWGDPLGPRAATRSGTWLFLAVVVFAVFYDLGWRSVHTLDLPRFGVLAREMIRSGEWLVPTRFGEVYANKPPLNIWLVAAPAALFGEVTPFLIRLPSALGFALLALAASAWGRVRTDSLGAGRVAALALLGTYALTRFGREGRPDMLAAGLCVAGTYLLDRAALGRGRAWDPWGAGLLLGLALLAKGPAYLLVPLLVLLLPTDGRSIGARVRAARPHVVLGVALATALLWFVPAVLHGGWAYGRTLLFDQATSRIAGEANHPEAWHYYFVRLVDGGAPWSPLYIAALLLWPTRLLGRTRSLGLAALLTLLLFSLVPTKHLRYVLPVFALLAVCAGWLVQRWLDRPAWRGWPKLLGASAVLLALVAAGCAVAAHRAAVDIVPLLLPIVLLLLLAVAAFSAAARGTSPEGARRRVAGGLLVAVVILVSTYWVVRDRYRVRTRDAFDRAIAEAILPEWPVYTLSPLDPGQVFHAAPGARLARLPTDLPAAPVQVVVHASDRRAVEAHLGVQGRVLLERPDRDDGTVVLLLAFDGG